MRMQLTTIAILAGGLVKDINGWRTTWFNEGDNFGGLGDRLRVVAASYLYKKNPETLIVVVGGKGQLSAIKDAPAVSEVISKELVDLGVPAEKIITETKSRNTLEGLIAVQEIICVAEYTCIALITNEYHLPRVAAMIGYSGKLNNILNLCSLGKFDLLSAEKICLDIDKSRWQSVIQKAYKSESIQQRIRNEVRGVNDLKKGRYVA